MEKKVVRISVRNLVEFILRSEIWTAEAGVQDKEAMQKGSRIHRKIQKQMGSSYRPEVSLKQDTEYEDLILRVEGRADGIFTEEETVCIDEIKGVYKKTGASGKPCGGSQGSGHVLCLDLYASERSGKNRRSDDVCPSGYRRNPTVPGIFFQRRAGSLVSETYRRIS